MQSLHSSNQIIYVKNIAIEPHCCSHTSLVYSRVAHARFRFSQMNEISPIVEFIAAQCLHSQQLSQGLTELMVNAVEHGNLGIRYEEKTELLFNGEWQNEIERRLAMPQHQSKYAILDYAVLPTGTVFTIRDQGHGFDWRPFMKFAPERWFEPNGRGIAIATSLDVWDVEYQGTGNRVVCRLRP